MRSHKKERLKFICVDCGYDTFHSEYYMLVESVWHSVAHENEMLCIGCIESRLGRLLTKADFVDAPINDIDFFTKSERLLDRLNRV